MMKHDLFILDKVQLHYIKYDDLGNITFDSSLCDE